MIREQETIFLGAVVQPKTWEPIWVQRKPHTYRTVNILTRGDYGVYVIAGEGYLDQGDDPEYNGPVLVTGYPRCHTPAGVKMKGGGYGTCLYTGLVLLASAIDDKEIWPDKMRGSGEGISSADDSRSSEASRWWRSALERGLTEQEEGEVEEVMEKEELEDEDLTDYMSSRSIRAITESIRDAVSDYGDGWWPSNVTIRGDLEREVPSSEGGELTADFYTLDSARKHKLVAIRETRLGGIMDWARATKQSDFPDYDDAYERDIILALNVTNQDPAVVGKLALCAREAGATETQITELVMRNRFGIDLVGKAIGMAALEDVRFDRKSFDAAGVLLQDSRGEGLATAGTARPNPRRRRRRPPPPFELPPFAMRRNPEPSRSERRDLERGLDRLARLREDLGVGKLEDLP